MDEVSREFWVLVNKHDLGLFEVCRIAGVTKDGLLDWIDRGVSEEAVDRLKAYLREGEDGGVNPTGKGCTDGSDAGA